MFFIHYKNIGVQKKYIIIFTIIIASFLFSLSSTFAFNENEESLEENTVADHYFTLENLYLKTYEELSDNGDADSISVRDKTYFSVAQSLGVEKSDIELMMLTNLPNFNTEETSQKKKQQALEKMVKICSNEGNTIQKFRKCQKDLKTRLQLEFNRQQFQDDLHEYALNNQAFINGTLQDTHGEYFDIIVDLNIIDLLLFGDKMNIPKTGSPFLRYNPFDDDDDDENSTASNNATPHSQNTTEPLSELLNSNITNIDTNSNSSENGSTISPADNTNINNQQRRSTITGESETLEGYTTIKKDGFCVNPDGIVFKNITSHTIVGDTTSDEDLILYNPYGIDNFTNPDTNSSHHSTSENSTSISSSYSSVLNTVYPNNFDDIQRGNFINPEIKYTGGVYPDLSKISHKRKCDADEDPFLNGRVCIKRICNEVLCIKINLKKGIKDRDKPLRKLDCVECHIDRGNEALSPLAGTLGQNTPNQHPMESNFLSAFGNLGKAINKSIYLMPKRLPFLAYDQAHPNQDKKPEPETNTQEESSEDSSTNTESDEQKKPRKYDHNRALYNALLISNCNELNTNFTKDEGYSVDQMQYCAKVDRENLNIQKAILQTTSKENTQKQIRSDNFDKMLRPFLQQFTKDMVIVNNYLQIIDPGNIKSKSKQCK